MGFKFEAGVLNEGALIVALLAIEANTVHLESIIAMFSIKTFNA